MAKKVIWALLGVLVVTAWLALFANSYAQFERRTAEEARVWKMSWADRR